MEEGRIEQVRDVGKAHISSGDGWSDAEWLRLVVTSPLAAYGVRGNPLTPPVLSGGSLDPSGSVRSIELSYGDRQDPSAPTLIIESTHDMSDLQSLRLSLDRIRYQDREVCGRGDEDVAVKRCGRLRIGGETVDAEGMATSQYTIRRVLATFMPGLLAEAVTVVERNPQAAAEIDLTQVDKATITVRTTPHSGDTAPDWGDAAYQDVRRATLDGLLGLIWATVDLANSNFRAVQGGESLYLTDMQTDPAATAAFRSCTASAHARPIRSTDAIESALNHALALHSYFSWFDRSNAIGQRAATIVAESCFLDPVGQLEEAILSCWHRYDRLTSSERGTGVAGFDRIIGAKNDWADQWESWLTRQ